MDIETWDDSVGSNILCKITSCEQEAYNDIVSACETYLHCSFNKISELSITYNDILTKLNDILEKLKEI